MIYIFNGCQQICSLPGLACKGCADLCGMMNCNWIKALCSGCGNCVVQFHTKPLSSYVIISFFFSGAVGYIAYSALSAEPPCTFKKDAMFTLNTFCYVELVCAVVNIVFALDFQMQVWKRIKTLIQKDYAENRHNEATLKLQEESYKSKMKKTGGGLLAQGRAQLGGGAAEQQETDEEDGEETKYRVLGKVVQDGFKEAFMEDCGVLIYFFASIGFLVLCYFAKTYITDGSNCKSKEMEGWAYKTGTGFFGIPAIYTFLWYCCACCAKAVPITGKDLIELRQSSMNTVKE